MHAVDPDLNMQTMQSPRGIEPSVIWPPVTAENTVALTTAQRQTAPPGQGATFPHEDEVGNYTPLAIIFSA